jgi:ubiquinone/menaquinone biosynthesis C-methylase UbiE
MRATRKGYRGLAMEGTIARWYAKNSGRDRRRFHDVAQKVTRRVASGGRVLEVAPGPGFCAIEIARSGLYQVTGLDISETFVRIAKDNARQAGVAIDFRHGNASEMPFPDASFDFVVCTAAFKNFSDPLGALNEIHRVLAPGGHASIIDLRKDASRDDIESEVRDMHLSAINALATRWTFRFVLLKRAYSRAALDKIVMASHFESCEIVPDGIGFELRLLKHGPALPTTSTPSPRSVRG